MNIKVGDRLYCIKTRESFNNKEIYNKFGFIYEIKVINVSSGSVWVKSEVHGVCFYTMNKEDDKFIGNYFIDLRGLRKLKLDLLKSVYTL